jgi:quercetin dioxygenase-like cupin family protein
VIGRRVREPTRFRARYAGGARPLICSFLWRTINQSVEIRHDIQRKAPKMPLKVLLATMIAVAILAPAAHAEPAPENSGQNDVVRTVFDQPTNLPGKSLEAVTVSYPPGAKSGAHHHAKSAFIMVYVISGAIRSQVEGEPARVYHAGETWSEAPGAHHTISENASTTEPAELLAVFLIDSGDGPLTTNDNAER